VANEAPRTRAAVLLHELVHVRDYQAGGLHWGDDLLQCYDVELRAFRAEADFWYSSQARHGNPKPATPLEADLDSIVESIYQGEASFVAKELVARYGASCRPTGGQSAPRNSAPEPQ
jgi:hypothetical protein